MRFILFFIAFVSFGVLANSGVVDVNRDFCTVSENKKICLGMPMEFSEKYVLSNIFQMDWRFRLITRNKPVKITKEKEPHVIEYKTGISNEITKSFNCYGIAITYDKFRKVSGIIYECDPVGDTNGYIRSYFSSKYPGLESKHRIRLSTDGSGPVGLMNSEFGVEFVRMPKNKQGYYLFNGSEQYQSR